jgi:hypothetical protein
MPGLVPGIHAVGRRVVIRTFNALLGARWLHRMELAMHVPTWMAGTRPAMTESLHFQGGPSSRRLMLAPMGRRPRSCVIESFGRDDRLANAVNDRVYSGLSRKAPFSPRPWRRQPARGEARDRRSASRFAPPARPRPTAHLGPAPQTSPDGSSDRTSRLAGRAA